ncbi:mitochondrial 2-oxodicarboxylate carrier-like [Chrysoperla carnea]|uniref:mitochondrial 2-oxodicarboxylate carrier-like n=1 Tax=Chrysoperla carnea TaxID=189513 RepID=UPI001D065C19|nr:mitochondrial 2-oxodicarboxylate carrier-like [Chrysoperla carnea]
MYTKDGKIEIEPTENESKYQCFGFGFSSVASGYLAGVIETIVTHPLDVVKARMQNQNKNSEVYKKSPNYYKNMSDCMIKMYKLEGFRSFFKGITVELMADPPRRAIRLSLFEKYNVHLQSGDGSPIMWALAGGFAGISESFVMTPFEHIKVKMQTNVLKHPPKVFTVVRNVIKTNGFGIYGLYRGLDSTILCKGIFVGSFFVVYNSLKNKLPVFENPHFESMAYFLCSFTSAVTGAFINTPFDVAKTRIQAVTNDKYNYVYCIPTMRHIYRMDGIGGLYQGLLPRLLFVGLENGVVMVVYEFVLTIFKQCIPND